MAYQVRCPECAAKLKLEDTPAADESIGCPKCGTQFTPAGASAAAAPAAVEAPVKKKKPKPDAGADDGPVTTKVKKKKKAAAAGTAPKGANDGNVGTRRKMKRKKSNKSVMVIMLGGAAVILVCIGLLGYLLLSKVGKLDDMLYQVPGECNLVRGVNSGQLSRYAIFKNELDKQMNGPFKEMWDGIAKGMSLPEDQALPDYVISGKNRGDGGGISGWVVVFRTKADLDAKALGAALAGAEAQSGGQTYYKLSGTRGGVLAGACVYMPTSRLVVVVPAGAGQMDFLAKSAGGRAAKEATFAGKLGRAGKKVAAGNVWLIVRSEGFFRGMVGGMLKPVAGDFGSLSSQADKTPMLGIWNNFGAKGIKFGGGIQCDSAESASALARSMKDGQMGKGDEAEIPNTLKGILSLVSSKEFKSEFMSNLVFRSTADFAYFESTMNKDKSTQLMSLFGNPLLFDVGSGGGQQGQGPPGQGGPGGPPGPPRGGPGGPPGPARPGGS